jgi:CubicO group peptidase (beta-lactamase class C family)
MERALADLPAPGLNAAVLVDDAVVWAHAAGLARYDPEEPLRPAHRHRIGSITKLFTAHAVLLLRDAGALDLDLPLRTYLPEFTGPGTERVTLRHVLCHGSGIPTNGLLDVWRTGVFPDRRAFRAMLAAMPLVGAPMEYIKYSNAAISLLGLVIDQVAGVPYETFVTDRVLAPLGARDTTFYLSAEQEARYAPGHTTPPYARRFDPAPYQDLRSWNACGMLASTTADVLRLARAQWRPGTLISEATRNEMHRLHSMDTDAPGWRIGYGLGWRLYRYGDRIFAGHGGAYVGNRCQVMLSLPDRVAVALFANGNQAAGVVDLAADLLTRTIEALAPHRAERAGGAAVPDDWRPLLGAYAVPHWQEIRIEFGPGGLRLVSPLEGGAGIRLKPLPDGRFLMLGGRAAAEPVEIVRRTAEGLAHEISVGGMVYTRI